MSKYTIEKADLQIQKDDILALLRRNLAGISEERFDWNYRKAPAICWTARDASSGELVGTCAIFLRDIFVNGRPFKAGIAGDFAVDKKHRTFGPALMMQKALLSSLKDEGVDFTYSIPNKLSEPLLVRLGYKELGVYRRYVKLLKTEYRENRSVLPSRIKKFISAPADLTLRALSRESRYIRPRGISSETPAEFDGRFNTLAEAAAMSPIIAGARTSRFLNWRYKESTCQDYRIFAVSRDTGALAGYIVFYVCENVAFIADMLYDTGFGDAAKILLSEFCLRMRKESIGSISIRYFGNGAVESVLKGMNFFEDKRNDTKAYVYCLSSSIGEEFLLKNKNWYFLEGDNDI